MESPTGPRTADTPRPSMSRHPLTAWIMLAIAAPVGGWLLFEIHRTIGLDSPRLWELLRTDRVFDVAMLDFFLTSAWAYLVILDRSSWKDWRLWVASPIFFAIPTLGIIVFVLLDRRKRADLTTQSEV